MSSRLLVSSSSLLWGLQFALLTPALALILSALYDASTADIGWTLAIYNTGAFIAALVIPVWADRHHSYVSTMLMAAVMTLLLALALALLTSLPAATAALVVLGGPAGVGVTLLFAHLRHAGESTAAIMNTRAVLAAAWMAGPPLAAAIIGVAGGRGVLWTIAAIAVANIATTVLLSTKQRPAAPSAADAPHHQGPRSNRRPAPPSAADDTPAAGTAESTGHTSTAPAPVETSELANHPSTAQPHPTAQPHVTAPALGPEEDPAPSAPPPLRLGRWAVTLVILAVTLFQTTNATAVSFLTIYSVETLQLEALWGGLALGIAAGLEIPALVIFGRIGDRVSHLTVMVLGAVAGVGYYLGIALATGPVMLIGLQVLNAITVATVAGIGMTLFQEILPGAGFSTGLFMNTRRIGAIISGPLIALGALEPLGQRGVFIACTVLTAIGLVVLEGVRRSPQRRESDTSPAPTHC